ncbi:MAG: hypothetical protein IPJ54_09280 [Saprospiraceae bacterium]|nr:hypothetical protein [Saprospiraceae bacterium]
MIVEKKDLFGTKALICVMNTLAGWKYMGFDSIGNFFGATHHFCVMYVSMVPSFAEN